MYRKLLLAGTMLAGVVAMQAKEVYVIKDGKVADGVELLKSGNKLLEIEEGVEAPGGEGTYLKYTIGKSEMPQYAGRFFYVADGINMDEVWMCDITYYFPEGTEIDGDNCKREGIRIDMMGDTTTVADKDTFKYDYNQASRRFAHLGYDVYFRNFYQYDDDTEGLELKNQGVGKDYTATRYIYTKSDFVDVLGNRNMVKAVSLACGHEAPTKTGSAVYYIKELKFYSAGIKPFYNEKFHSAVDAAAISASGSSPVKYTLTLADNKIDVGNMAKIASKIMLPEEIYGASYLYCTLDANPDAVLKNDQITGKAERLWQDNGIQSKDGLFYDVETGYMIEIKKAGPTGVGTYKDNSILIRIPFTGAVEEGEDITVKFLAGHHGCATCAAFTDYDKEASKAPFSYRFEKGSLTTIESATDIKNFTSLDTLPINIVEVEEKITVPAGGYNILTVFFNSQKQVSYLVGDMTVTGSKTVVPSKSEKTVCGELMMPVAFGGSTGIDDVVAVNNLSIYPNPVYNVFTVAGEVEKLEVINLTGSVVLSVASNKANVANLPNGMYIVKAYSESGIATGTIIKK